MATTIFGYVSKQIKPEEWTNIGHYYYVNYENAHGENDVEYFYEVEFPESVSLDKEEFLDLALSNGICNCCNHKIKRGCFFHSKKEDKIIFVGFDCARNIMQYRFDVAGAKKQTLAARKRQMVINNIDRTFEENPGLEDALKKWNKIIREIAVKFNTSGKISEKQIAFVMKLAQERDKYEEDSKPALTGKVKDQFKILSIKPQPDDNYSKILVQHNNGWKAWGNMNNTLAENVKIGDNIQISASFVVSEKDKFFAFFKRPRYKVNETRK